MSEHLRTLIVILGLASVLFFVVKKPASDSALTSEDFERRRNLWFAITLTAFLTQNFWIYILVTFALLIFTLRREPNSLAMYYFLLFTVPPIAVQISGLGIIEQLFTIQYPRLLSLTILLSAFLFLRKEPDTERLGRPPPFANLLPGLLVLKRQEEGSTKLGRSLPDFLVIAYLVLQFLVELRGDTITNSLRVGVWYGFLDVFLPYYVASRSLKNIAGFRDALMSFVIAGLVLSVIGCFEAGMHWLLYKPLKGALGVQWNMGDYLSRGDTLRAQASTGHPIVLGYVIAVAMGLYLFVKHSISRAWVRRLGLALLFAGLIAPISRGPWVGAGVMLFVFVALGPRHWLNFLKLGLVGAAALPLLLMTPAGAKVISLLPFVGNVETENVTYRQQLLEVSYQVIMQNPFFGSVDYANSPLMQRLVQGEGIIDIVNTYVEVTLTSGFVGLALFLGFFLTVAVNIFKSMKTMTDGDEELFLLGQALVSTLLGVLVIIFTVSSISFIPVVYWTVAGLGVGYTRMLAQARLAKEDAARHAASMERDEGDPFTMGGSTVSS